MHKKNRVLIVDDSAVARIMMSRGLSSQPSIEVVDAIPSSRLPMVKPDQLRINLVIYDIDGSKSSTEDWTRNLAAFNRIPILVVSSSELKSVSIMGRGVVGFVQKPITPQDTQNFLKKLSSKIVLALADHPEPCRSSVAPIKENKNLLLGPRPGLDDTIIALGASTGGTEATLEVLKLLPADLPPMVIVQHMPAGFTKMYAERLDRSCELNVVEASDSTVIKRGTVYVAPAGYQTRVLHHGGDLMISSVLGEKVTGHCPSVNVLFASVAEVKAKNKVGIILTGMGRDGAKEMLTLRNKGGYTIGQDEKSSVVYGMPMEAHLIGAVQIQGDLPKIAEILLNHLRRL